MKKEKKMRVSQKNRVRKVMNNILIVWLYNTHFDINNNLNMYTLLICFNRQKMMKKMFSVPTTNQKKKNLK